MLIQLTQEHIDHGQKAECGECPLALMLDEVLVGTYKSRVFGYAIHIYDKTYVQRFYYRILKELPVPSACWQFIRMFDECEHVEPKVFDIPITEEYATRAAWLEHLIMTKQNLANLKQPFERNVLDEIDEHRAELNYIYNGVYSGL